jgi:hypothetical protein
MDRHYISRREIGDMLGLKSAAVASLCATPGFPAPLVVNARVYRYQLVEVEAFLAGRVGPVPRANNRVPVAAGTRRVNWVVDVSCPAPKQLTKV